MVILQAQEQQPCMRQVDVYFLVCCAEAPVEFMGVLPIIVSFLAVPNQENFNWRKNTWAGCGVYKTIVKYPINRALCSSFMQ